MAELREAGEQVVLAGDFNVTRDDRDVYDPAAFEGDTHVTPEEREALEAILDRGGLADAYRALHDGEQFTWWDYRQGHFHRGLGLRIDYILLSRGAGRVAHRLPHRARLPQGHQALGPRAAGRRVRLADA